MLISSTRLSGLLPESFVLLVILDGVRAVYDLIAIEVSNATNEVTEEALGEVQILRERKRRLGLQHLKVFLVEAFSGALDLLRDVVRRERHFAALGLEEDIEFECALKDLLDEVHVALARTVLDGIRLPWRWHLFGRVFLDISFDRGFHRSENECCIVLATTRYRCQSN